MECMELPLVRDDWSIQAFIQGLNERSSVASRQLKQNLIEYSAVTWADVHNQTEDCRQLKDEVACLFNEGHLREFLSDRAKNHFRERDANRKNEQEEPQHVIHMIVGGVDIPQGPVFKRTKVSITREKQTREYVPEGTVSFNNEEAEGISHPHNDALVISILLDKVQVKRVLVDPGSSENIIRSRVVEQLGLQDQIVPAARVLNGFNMASETIKREIILPVNVAGTIQDSKFHVIEGDEVQSPARNALDP
ncbi:uncharacterized protein [Nicotiana sylvestris]|uniref:uncharacterized protein n=1 Tax=Nicotiana sylvestris TaxID=4096 RepID=UPI00388C5104